MRISQFILTLTIILTGDILLAQDISWNEKEFILENTISFDKTIENISVEDFQKLNFSDEIRVFGIGEANHGTREFQVLKLKLAEYLIQEKRLNTIILEFPYPMGLLIDDYVKGKNENGLKILTDQKDSEYKNTDFINFIDTIKKMNEARDEVDKISFLGGDIFGKPTAIKLLRTYFEKVDPSQLGVFTKYQQFEADTYMSGFRQNKKVFDGLSKKVSVILKRNRDTCLKRSTLMEYNKATRLAESLKLKWNGNIRAISFANNVIRTLSENSDNKILVIAHNRHIGMLDKEVGGQLREKLNDKYFAIGTDYEEGTFSLWNLKGWSPKNPDNRFVDTLYTPKLEMGFANKFSDLPGKFHYISLVEARKSKSDWATKENYIASIGMGFNKDLLPVDFRQRAILTKYFDGIFIFKKIHSSNRFE